jgi:hypothetical protein
MPESFRCGIYFKTATRPVPVENFLRRVGTTRLDTSDGPQKNKQTFWFPSKAAFDRELPGIIESITAFTVHHPIPVFQAVEAEVSEEQPLGSAEVERRTHNPEDAGSIPAPATSSVEDEAPAEEVETPESKPEPEVSPAHAVQEPVKNKGGRPRKNK